MDGPLADPRTEVARVPITPNRDLDLLFVIDDSPSMLDKQTNLKSAFPAFINELNLVEGGLPNVHIGVVTSDLGTKGALDTTAGPMIGNGPGACTGNGKSGNLQTNGTTLVSGSFISDTKNTDGTRTTNYAGALTDAFSAIASVGASGCGFEQHIEAAKRALNNNPANAGFLRPNASLAIIVLGDEDDCSLAHSTLLTTDTTTLGPLQSFRCTRFGIICDTGGTTPDLMNAPGVKGQCHSDASLTYFTRIDDYGTFFKSLKASANQVLFAAIIGPQLPFEIELRTPAGGGTAIPALAHSCSYTGANGPEVADPAVRIVELAVQFAHNTVSTVCSMDLSAPLIDVARNVRSLAGDPCLTKEIAKPYDCVVVDEIGTTKTTLPACGGSVVTDCYQLVSDPNRCTTPSHLKVEVMRSTTPAAGTVTVVRCKL
ncbi:MAG TPA: hypothetical protein VIV40_40035 [Kofleriaceae bacterium]